VNRGLSKISYDDFICKIVIAYSVLFNMAIIVTESGGRRLAQFSFCLMIIGILRKRKKRDIIVLFITGIFCLYNLLLYGVSYIMHIDFYGFILLILIMTFFSDKSILNCLEHNLLNEKYVNTVLALFFISIIISIVFCNGLRPSAEWGVSIPMLFGPFELPHELAYELIIVYCMSSILFHHKYKLTYLIIMGLVVLLIAWTGVRSAFLALAFLIVFDYFSIRRTSIKLLLLFLGIGVLAYLALFTDFIVNNPIVQKTINALNGSSGISNGRGMMNNYLVDVYMHKLSFSDRMFGIGMTSLRGYMYSLTATHLHAHNDIFNILIGHGLIGLFVFCKQLIRFSGSMKKKKVALIAFIVLFVLLFTNGLYMYVCFTPCIAIVLIYSKYLNIKV